MSIEPVSFCNLQCPECPAGNGTLTRNKEKMSFSLFAEIVEQIKSHVLYLTLYFQGEPYLNTDFLDFVQLAAQNNIYTASSTNGHFLTDEIAKKTVESGLNKLIISVDGSSQEIYEKYRRGGDLEKVLLGITHLVKWKKELHSKTPFIEMQFLVFKHNEHQIDEVRNLAKRLEIDKLSLKTAQFNDFEEIENLIPTQKKYSRYTRNSEGKYQLKKKIRNRCWRVFNSLVICANGDVLPCCFDKNGDFSFGNIQENSLSEIWTNKKALQFRKQILRDRKLFPICNNCTE